MNNYRLIQVIIILLSLILLGIPPIHAEDTPPVAPNYKFSGSVRQLDIF